MLQGKDRAFQVILSYRPISLTKPRYRLDEAFDGLKRFEME